jgi:hypothetical protein
MQVSNIQSWLDYEDRSADRSKVPPKAYMGVSEGYRGGGYRVNLNSNDQTTYTAVADSQILVNPDNTAATPTGFATAGQMVQFKLERQNLGIITDIAVAIVLNATSAAVTPTPAPYLFDHIEFWGNSANGDLLQR